ncbi:hypothetical protein L2E82_11454 [Cichorium intybus]|uniref:Uncharacterized protein n=1 Tax=Cichorium intybus TaxID=13427 RepID=A0ACB9GD52_CICIN|nr:hypothetical protein L1887_13687 [Cichorium endivia]KAI3781439.1 hypothetical protein L2E82_11454 [Cichorium intybus]
MVLLHFTTIPPTVCCQLSSSRSTSAVTFNAFSRVERKSFNLNGLESQRPFVLKHNQRGSLIMKAAGGVDGAEVPETATPPPVEAKDESLSVEELPLESKVQAQVDQKLKMKLAKKIRMRRKRLVRKRQLRKKGRWPPSKMKKNKNV